MGEPDTAALKKAEAAVHREAAVLNGHLGKQPYLVNGTLTLADFVLAGVIYAAARVALGSAERAKYPHVFAHYTKVTADERVKQYWGTEEFVDVRITELKTITW